MKLVSGENSILQLYELTPEEEAEYRAMDPGITQTKHMIRAVAVDGDVKQVVELTSNCISRIRVRMK